MSKWRPAEECLYVIPDIHGFSTELKVLLDQILPLKDSDKLIFLGDYIDRGPDTPGTIDLLIGLKYTYPYNTVFLCGNHEEMLLAALGLMKVSPSVSAFIWIENGGASTLDQYNKRVGGDLKGKQLKTIMPPEHICFIKNTEYYHKHDKYVFVHAGLPNHDAPIEEQEEGELAWDRTLYEFVKRGGKFKSEYTVVTGHNYKGPFVIDNFMMLDCSAQHKLIVAELNSREICSVDYYSNEIKKDKLRDTPFKKPIFRRVQG